MIQPEYIVDVAQWVEGHSDVATPGDYHLACFNRFVEVQNFHSAVQIT